MKIPSESSIAREKLTQYLLVPKPKDDKSAFLAQAGFSLHNSDALESALRRLITENEAISDRENQYGIFYQVRGRLHGPSDILSVVTAWLQAHVDREFRFITLKPER